MMVLLNGFIGVYYIFLVVGGHRFHFRLVHLLFLEVRTNSFIFKIWTSYRFKRFTLRLIFHQVLLQIWRLRNRFFTILSTLNLLWLNQLHFCVMLLLRYSNLLALSLLYLMIVRPLLQRWDLIRREHLRMVAMEDVELFHFIMRLFLIFLFRGFVIWIYQLWFQLLRILFCVYFILDSVSSFELGLQRLHVLRIIGFGSRMRSVSTLNMLLFVEDCHWVSLYLLLQMSLIPLLFVDPRCLLLWGLIIWPLSTTADRSTAISSHPTCSYLHTCWKAHRRRLSDWIVLLGLHILLIWLKVHHTVLLHILLVLHGHEMRCLNSFFFNSILMIFLMHV